MSTVEINAKPVSHKLKARCEAVAELNSVVNEVGRRLTSVLEKWLSTGRKAVKLDGCFTEAFNKDLELVIPSYGNGLDRRIRIRLSPREFGSYCLVLTFDICVSLDGYCSYEKGWKTVGKHKEGKITDVEQWEDLPEYFDFHAIHEARCELEELEKRYNEERRELESRLLSFGT